jgi:hypothetical protein
VRAHQGGRDDGWVRFAPLLDRVGRFMPGAEPEVFAALRLRRAPDGRSAPMHSRASSVAPVVRFARGNLDPKPAAHGNDRRPWCVLPQNTILVAGDGSEFGEWVVLDSSFFF